MCLIESRIRNGWRNSMRFFFLSWSVGWVKQFWSEAFDLTEKCIILDLKASPGLNVHAIEHHIFLVAFIGNFYTHFLDRNNFFNISWTQYSLILFVFHIQSTAFPIARRIGHPYQNRTPPKRKKPRTSFTRIQVSNFQVHTISRHSFGKIKKLKSERKLKMKNTFSKRFHR